MSRKLLEDVTILDLTWVMAGPGATKMFSDLGARVIKVENNRTVDVLRTGWQRKNNDDFNKEGGWAFQDFNRGKLDIALNLKQPGGRQVLEELVGISDFVVCNYSARAFRKLKLTYEDLKEFKEDIIVVNASSLGDYGPYSGYITYAPSLMSLTGLLGCYGYEGADSPEMPTPIADYMGSLTMASYMMAALEYRRLTGKGQFIDLSQGDAATALLGTAILECQANDTDCGRIGNRDYTGSAAPHNVYKCRGDDFEWCAIACCNEGEWTAFRGVADPENAWSGDEKFATLAGRLDNLEELDAHIEAWTMQHTPEEVGELCQAAGVSGAPVQTNYDLLHFDEHMKERGFYVPLDLAPEGKYPENFLVCNMVPHMSNVERAESFHRAPAWGEHTEYILKELLGKTDEWIAQNPIL